MTFEEALERLGKIASEMEDPALPLNDAVKLYAEASDLAVFCRQSVKDAKLSIEKINAGKNIIS